jgi:uncharacterized membrane protein
MTLRRITLILLIVYALMAAYSIIGRLLGIAPSSIITPLVTICGFSFALAYAGQREGWKRALWLLALVFVVSLLFESVGVATGWVYGYYHYSDLLGPKFLGLVPYLIPVAWFMMSYPSFVIADTLVPSGWKNWQRVLGVAAVGGLAMTAWDVVMDPIMVSGGYWIWDRGGAYFGIPLQNFWGWWLTVFTTFALYLWLVRQGKKVPEMASDWQTLVSYLVTGASLIIGSLLYGTGGLALIGFFTMMPWVVAAGLRLSGKSPSA